MGVERIDAAFARLRDQKEKALVPFVMGGDPSLLATKQFIAVAEKAGADMIEIGIPFSDPLADGVINQQAAQRALQNGIDTSHVLSLVAKVRSSTTIPLVLLSYFNPLLRYGLDDFCADAAEAGVDGLIIPDLPLEERIYREEHICSYGMALIPMLAPNCHKERIRKITAGARGFVYCVSVTGVTGIQNSFHADLHTLLKYARDVTSLPCLVGFGIHTASQAEEAASLGDGVIVGSRLVRLIAEAGSDIELASRELGSAIAFFKQALPKAKNFS